MPDFAPAFEVSSAGVLSWTGGKARCAIGRSGVVPAETKREGDGATPLGVWPLRKLFWRPDRMEKPATHLPAIALDATIGWCDDPAHPAYNRQIQLPFPASHEKLWREDHIYDLIVVLGFNDDPVIAGRGSAIFLHLARPDFSPTEGCVACGQSDLLDILKQVRAGNGLSICQAEA
jgi:L,D-peptidoglycan transpeptidase YkuD (ErfK/YbiS/YcfS/YnhG family)